METVILMANVVLACIVFKIILALLDAKAHPVQIGIIVRGRHQQHVQYVHPVHLDIFRIAMAPQSVRYAVPVLMQMVPAQLASTAL